LEEGEKGQPLVLSGPCGKGCVERVWVCVGWREGGWYEKVKNQDQASVFFGKRGREKRGGDNRL